MFKSIKVATLLVGVLTLSVSVALLFVNPIVTGSLPDGFFNPIIALEFIDNSQSLASIFDISTADDIRQSFQLGNYIDYFFMVLYTSFIILCTIWIYLKSHTKSIFLIIPIVLIALVGDVFENLTLAEILKIEKFTNAGLLIEQLQLYTWLKWESLGAVMLIFSIFFFQGSIVRKLLGALMLSTFILGIVTFFNRGIFCEIYSNMIVVCFLSLFFFVLTSKNNADT